MTKSIKVESRPISSLKPHPRQDEYFAPASEAEIERLAEDIKVSGLVTPVRILRDGTIVCGHTACRDSVARHRRKRRSREVPRTATD